MSRVIIHRRLERTKLIGCHERAAVLTIFTAGIVTNSCRAIDKHSHHPILAIWHIVSPRGP